MPPTLHKTQVTAGRTEGDPVLSLSRRGGAAGHSGHTRWPRGHRRRVAFLTCPQDRLRKAAGHLGTRVKGRTPRHRKERLTQALGWGLGWGVSRWEGPWPGFGSLPRSLSQPSRTRGGSDRRDDARVTPAKEAALLSGQPPPSPPPPPGSRVLRSGRRASPRPGARWGAAFPGPPPFGALGTPAPRALRAPSLAVAPRTALRSGPRPGDGGPRPAAPPPRDLRPGSPPPDAGAELRRHTHGRAGPAQGAPPTRASVYPM